MLWPLSYNRPPTGLGNVWQRGCVPGHLFFIPQNLQTCASFDRSAVKPHCKLLLQDLAQPV